MKVISSDQSLMSRLKGQQFLEFCARSLHVKNFRDFETWIKEHLAEMFPHETMTCGIGQLNGEGITFHHQVEINVSLGSFSEFLTSVVLDDNPIILRWLKDREPQLIEHLRSNDDEHSRVEANEKRELHNAVGHGMVERDGRSATYFSFHRVPEKLEAYHADMLKLLMPYLHSVLTRVVKASKESAATSLQPMRPLTQRELDILHWVREGKSNWEIAKIYGRSENTVKHEVANILTKMSATTRAQAAARAVDLGLIKNSR